MRIYRAIKSNIKTQGFGIEGTKPSMLAFYKSIGLLAHNGIDWAIRCQDNQKKDGGLCEAIFWDCDCYGKIAVICNDRLAGLGYGIISEDKDGIFKHIFCHLDSLNPKLKVGDIVGPADFLGIGGNTGQSTGAHLHRGLKPMGKDTYGNYYVKDRNNGYDGAVDLKEHFINKFILDYFEELKNIQTQINVFQTIINVFKKLINIIK